MNDAERARFDELLEDALAAIPDHLHQLLEHHPLVVEDRPGEEVLRSMGLPPDELLCGLHTGVALTERTVEDSATLPDQIHIYREGVVETAGGWDQPHADQEVYEEIWITLLHEIGHHFGLDEDDLADLGYD